MATYSYTIERYSGLTGTYWSSSASGYQIGGNNPVSSANAIMTLPNNYSSFSSCSLTFTFYAYTLNSSYSFPLRIYKNNSYLVGGTISMNMLSGASANNRQVRINLSGATFKAGDVLEIEFDGSAGGYLTGTNCLHICSVYFYSESAIQINPIIPGVPSNALKRADTGYPLYYNGYVAVTNASQLNDTTVYIAEDDWTTYYETGFFWGGNSSYGDVEVNGTWFMKAILSTSQNLNSNPRYVVYRSGCSYRIPGKVYITTA